MNNQLIGANYNTSGLLWLVGQGIFKGIIQAVLAVVVVAGAIIGGVCVLAWAVATRILTGKGQNI